jgi:hypothetical protein
MGKIQKQDIKTVAELTNAGATAADLPNDDQIFVSALNINKTLKDAITDGNIGGDGGLGVNYFSDARANTIANFVLYNDGGATPTDGVGGTVTGVTKTLNTATPIMGTSSYRLSKDAANRQGQGGSLTTDKTLDAPVVAGEPITVQFRYRTSANYTTGDVRMFVYFVGPNTLQALNGISNAGEFGNSLVKSFDDRSQFTANTSCPAGTTAIRVIGHIATTSTSAYDIDIDEITIGTAAQLVTQDPFGGSFKATRAGGSNITINVNNSEQKLLFNSVSDNLAFQRGLVYDSANSRFVCVNSGTYYFSVQVAVQNTNVVSTTHILRLKVNNIVVLGEDRVPAANSFFTLQISGTQTLSAGDVVECFFFSAANYSSNNITITGSGAISWFAGSYIPNAEKTNVISSTQANFVSGAFRASRNGTNQTGVNPNDSFVKINFNSVSGSGDYVRGGFSYDTANSRFVANKNMTVNATARLNFFGTNSLVVNYLAFIYVNGSIALAGNSSVPPTAGSTFSLSVSGILRLNVGDIVEVFMYGAGNNSSNTLTMIGNSTSYFSIAEIPDLSVVGISGASLEILHTTSSQKTPAGTGQWHAHTGNSLTLTPGVWRLSARGGFFNNGSLAGYTVARVQIGSSNGGDSGTEPPLSGPNFQILDGGAPTNVATIVSLPNGAEDIISHTPQKIVSVVSTQTFFANSLALMATPANSRIIVSLTAERIR